MKGEGETEMSISGHSVIACCVEVRTHDLAIPAAQSAGFEPDALTMLIKMLATLFDDNDVITGRQSAGSAKPATCQPANSPLTVIDMQVIPSKGGVNVRPTLARAKLAMRFADGPDREDQLASLMNHLKAVAPNGARVFVEHVPS